MAPCDARVVVRTPAGLMAQATARAKAEGISRSEFIRRALRARVEPTA